MHHRMKAFDMAILVAGSCRVHDGERLVAPGIVALEQHWNILTDCLGDTCRRDRYNVGVVLLLDIIEGPTQVIFTAKDRLRFTETA